MKIHSDVIGYEGDVRRGLDAPKLHGDIDRNVIVEVTRKGSRSHSYAYDVSLEWVGDKVKGDGRRHKNSGKYGADTGTYAAFYDEWGWFLAQLFELDPNMVAGRYKGYTDFHQSTDFKFC